MSAKGCHRIFLLALAAAVLALGACAKREPRTYRVPKETSDAENAEPRALPGSAPTAPTSGGGTAEGAPGGPVAGSAGGEAPSRRAPGGGNQGMQILPGMRDASESAGRIDYSVPEAWEEFPPEGIRKANFRVPGENGEAELTVLAFQGAVGGALANVNRWNRQIGARPIDQAELGERVGTVAVGEREGQRVRLDGPKGSVLAAIVSRGNYSWFFKLQGPTPTVDANADRFREFLASVEIKAAQAE